MGAIGEYIHNTAYGYAVFGIDRMQQGKGSKRALPAMAMNIQKEKVRQQVHSATLNKLSPQDKLKIEKQISALMVQPSKSKNQGIKIAWEIICEQLKIDFYDEVPNQIQNESGQVKNSVNKIKSTKGGRHLLSTIIDRINKINTLIPQLKSGQTLSSLQGKLDQIYSQLEGISKLTKDEIQKFGASGMSAKQYLNNIKQKDFLIDSETVIDSETGKTIIDLINQSADIVKGLSSYVKGEMFQLLVTISQLKAQQLSRQEIKKTIEKQWVGAGTSAIRLKEVNFAKGIDINKLSGTIRYNDEISCYVDGRSANKIDTYYQYQGKTYNASIKNVNLYAYPYISLVTDASFLVLMQSMDYDFVNHYLNIMATHYAMPPGFNQVEHPIFNQAELRNLAKQTMNLSLLLAAFIGHKLDVDTADIFIVNNNAAGVGDPRVKVFNIGELVAKAVDDISLVNVKLSVDKEQYPNKYANTIEERLTTLLSQVHSIKVKVQFSNTALGMTH